VTGLPGVGVDPVVGDLPPVDVESAYDGHRDLLWLPPCDPMRPACRTERRGSRSHAIYERPWTWISSPTFTSRKPVPKAAANRRIVCGVLSWPLTATSDAPAARSRVTASSMSGSDLGAVCGCVAWIGCLWPQRSASPADHPRACRQPAFPGAANPQSTALDCFRSAGVPANGMPTLTAVAKHAAPLSYSLHAFLTST
jgi:hypothetical protein